MVEFTIYFESIRPTGTGDRMVDLDTNRSECKSSIVLTNVFAKGIRVRAYTTEEVLESWRRGRKWREINLTLKTTLTKFLIVLGGSFELFCIPVKGMAVLTFNIHGTKRMTTKRFLISLPAWRKVLLSEGLKILIQLSSLCRCLCSLSLCLSNSLSLCLSYSFSLCLCSSLCNLLSNSGSVFSSTCLIICCSFSTCLLFLLHVNSLCLCLLLPLKLLCLLCLKLILHSFRSSSSIFILNPFSFQLLNPLLMLLHLSGLHSICFILCFSLPLFSGMCSHHLILHILHNSLF